LQHLFQCNIHCSLMSFMNDNDCNLLAGFLDLCHRRRTEVIEV
jgi:hypothetical protein